MGLLTFCTNLKVHLVVAMLFVAHWFWLTMLWTTSFLKMRVTCCSYKEKILNVWCGFSRYTADEVDNAVGWEKTERREKQKAVASSVHALRWIKATLCNVGKLLKRLSRKIVLSLTPPLPLRLLPPKKHSFSSLARTQFLCLSASHSLPLTWAISHIHFTAVFLC